MNPKTAVRNVLVGVGIALLTTLLCGVLLYALMQTGWGREKTAHLAGKALSRGPQDRVVITGLEGRVPTNFRIGRLAWQDREGVWLTAENIALRWRPWDLLKGIVRVNTLHVSALKIDRPSLESQESPSPSSWPPPWLSALQRVRVEDLLVERLTLEETLTGEAAVLSLRGWMRASPTAQEASVTVDRLDRPGTNLDARALLREGRLALDLKVEDRGDLLSRRIGLDGPITASLQGEGALENWKGDLKAEAARYGKLASTVSLEADREVLVKAQGALRLDPESLPPAVSPWVRGETPFDLEAAWSEGSLTVRRFTANREQGTVTLSGSVDLDSGSTAGEFRLSLPDLESLSGITPPRPAGRFTLEGRISGMLLHPVLEAQVELTRFSFHEVELSALHGTIRLAFSQSGSHTLSGRGDVRDLTLPGFRESLAQWRFELAGPSENRVEIKEAAFLGEGLSLHAEGGLGLAEPLTADLRMNGRWALPPSLASLEPFSGKAVSYEGRVVFEEGTRIRVTRALLESPDATLQAEGSFHIPKNTLAASWDLGLPRLRSVGSALGVALEGSVRVKSSTEGPLDRLTTRAEVKGTNLLIRGVPVESAHLNLLARGLPPDASGRVSVSVVQSGHNLQSSADFVLDRKKISFSSLRLEGPATEIAGGLEIELETGGLAGSLKGRCEDLSALSVWLGDALQGKADFEGEFVLGRKSSVVSLALDAEGLSSAYAKARRVHIRARVEEPLTAPEGRLNVDMTEALRGDTVLASASVQLDGNFGRTRFQTSATGRSAGAFQFRGSGFFSARDRSGTLDHLKGSYRGSPVNLAAPLTLRIGPEDYSVQGLALEYGGGLIKGAGKMQKNDLDFRLEMMNLALDGLPAPPFASMTGTLSGDITLKGTPAEPLADLALRVSDLKTGRDSFRSLPALSVEGGGTFRDRRLTADFTVQGLSSDPFSGRLILPLQFSLSPVSLETLPRAPLEGSLSGEIGLERITALLGLDRQTAGGRASLGLQVDGTMESPKVSGYFRVKNGTYENLGTGTVLTRASIDLSASAPRLRILEAKASDGEGGTLVAEGWLDLTPDQGFPLNVSIRLDQAKLFRLDEGAAVVSGALSLEGSVRSAALSGRIKVDSADFRIPDRLPGSITEVDVVEINKEEPESPPAKARDGKGLSWPLDLDVVVESSGRTFVRGRGIDTEWEGQLTISGKASQPSITGTVSVVRGRADFLGRSFDVKRGTLAFGGDYPPSPFMDIIAEASAKEVTAQLNIRGVLPVPEITLSSQPPLPSDEILARLLFGRSANNLTPVQALQLADALKTMSGGGTDLLGRSRRFLGVDRLAVTSSGEDLKDTGLSAGKYLSEDVYVEVEKGISPETGKASVKWEMTPNVTVDTEVGINAEAGVGIQWRWDY